MLHSRDGVLWVMCWVGFVPNLKSCTSARKVPYWFLQTTNLFATWLQNLRNGFLHISNGTKVGLFWVLASFLPPHRNRPDLWSAWDIIVMCTQCPVFAIKAACSFFKVANGLLVASLISLLLAWSSSLEGRSDIGRVLVVPYTFHFLMIVLTVLQGIFKAFEIFLYPSPDLCLSSPLSWRSFESSLVLMVESLLWNALPSRWNLQEQLILFWNNKKLCNLTQEEAN